MSSKYSMNAFEGDVEGLSYFLGFIYGDGSFDSNGKLYVYSTDRDILEKINKRLNYAYPIGVTKRPPNKDLYRVIFYANNAKYFLNMTARRKEDFGFPVGVNLFHFLRGLMDADGTLRIKKTSKGYRLNGIHFLCREKLGQELQKRLCLVGITATLRPHKKVKQLSVVGECVIS